jgi:hypothetical protein
MNFHSVLFPGGGKKGEGLGEKIMIKWNDVVHNLHANYHAVTAGELYHVAMHKHCALLTPQIRQPMVLDFKAFQSVLSRIRP